MHCLFAFIVGDDWEHEEIFTDDDEAVGNDPEEREDLAPEVPAPPEIKQVCYIQCQHLANSVSLFASHSLLCRIF